MQKKFLSSLSLILLLNILVKPLYILGIDAEVQNRVGQEAYGTYFWLLNLSLIFNILIDFGINNFNNRNIAQNEQLIGKHFSKLLTVKAFLAIVYAAATMLLGLALGIVEGNFEILAVMVFNQVLVSFILFARSNLAGLHLFGRDSVVSVLDRGLLIIFCGILLFTNISGGRFEILWFVYLQTAAYTLTLVMALLMIGRRKVAFRWDFDKPFALHILRKSLPYALFILSGSMYTRIDGIMLAKLLPDGNLQAGHYAQGYRFYEAAGMFAFLFAVLLLPIYSKMLKKGEAVKPMVELSARLLLGTGLMAAVFFLFKADWLLHWRYDVVVPEAVYAFSALMFGFVGVCMFYIYGTLMTANENLKSLNLISAGGLLLNLVLNFILIPEYAALGAAVTTMLTQLFAGAAMMLFLVTRFRMGVNFRLIAQLGFFTFSFLAAAYYIDLYMPDELWSVASTLAAGVFLLLISGVFRPRQIATFLKAE